jgi:hypothetical protein
MTSTPHAGSAREYERALEKLKDYRYRVRACIPPRGLSKSKRAQDTPEASDGDGDATVNASPSSSTISALDKVLSDPDKSPSCDASPRGAGMVQSTWATGCSPWGAGEEHQRVRTSESVEDDRWTALSSSHSSATSSASEAAAGPREYESNAVRRRYLSKSARECSAEGTDDEDEDASSPSSDDEEEEEEEDEEEEEEEEDAEETQDW